MESSASTRILREKTKNITLKEAEANTGLTPEEKTHVTTMRDNAVTSSRAITSDFGPDGLTQAAQLIHACLERCRSAKGVVEIVDIDVEDSEDIPPSGTPATDPQPSTNAIEFIHIIDELKIPTSRGDLSAMPEKSFEKVKPPKPVIPRKGIAACEGQDFKKAALPVPRTPDRPQHLRESTGEQKTPELPRKKIATPQAPKKIGVVMFGISFTTIGHQSRVTKDMEDIRKNLSTEMDSDKYCDDLNEIILSSTIFPFLDDEDELMAVASQAEKDMDAQGKDISDIEQELLEACEDWKT